MEQNHKTVHVGTLDFIGGTPALRRPHPTGGTVTTGFIPYDLQGKEVRITVEELKGKAPCGKCAACQTHVTFPAEIIDIEATLTRWVQEQRLKGVIIQGLRFTWGEGTAGVGVEAVSGCTKES